MVIIALLIENSAINYVFLEIAVQACMKHEQKRISLFDGHVP